MDDAELGKCWGQSLSYYTERMAQGVSGYAATLMFIQRWRNRNNREPNFELEALDK